jgi:hypothetical protein
MTSTDRNDLMPTQEKLEWVTPKISLMVGAETDGTNKQNVGGEQGPFGDNLSTGPS